MASAAASKTNDRRHIKLAGASGVLLALGETPQWRRKRLKAKYIISAVNESMAYREQLFTVVNMPAAKARAPGKEICGSEEAVMNRLNRAAVLLISFILWRLFL